MTGATLTGMGIGLGFLFVLIGSGLGDPSHIQRLFAQSPGGRALDALCRLIVAVIFLGVLGGIVWTLLLEGIS
jgi:hypothetical protein